MPITVRRIVDSDQYIRDKLWFVDRNKWQQNKWLLPNVQSNSNCRVHCECEHNQWRWLRLLIKVFVLVCLPPQQSWDCAWNDSDVLSNIFEPVRSDVNHSLSQFLSTRITFAMKVNDFCDFFEKFCFVGHGFKDGDYWASSSSAMARIFERCLMCAAATPCSYSL